MSENIKKSLKKYLANNSGFNQMIGSSVNFWKNDAIISSKLINPCCCTNEKSEPETQNNDNIDLIENASKIKPKKKVFKTYKETLVENVEIPKEKKKYNDWTPEEDLLLIKLYNSGLNKSWKKISNVIKNKTPRMCGYRIKKLEKLVMNNNYESIAKNKINIEKQEFMKLNENIISIPENLIENEIKKNGFMNFKTLRKRRKMLKKKIHPSTKPNKPIEKDSKPTFQDFWNYQVGTTENTDGMVSPDFDPFQNYENEMKKKKSSKKPTKDIDMKSQSSKSHQSQEKYLEKFQFFAFSRKNSPNLAQEDKGDFQKAYNQVFQENEKRSHEINDNKIQDKSENQVRTDWTDKNENYMDLEKLKINEYPEKIDVFDTQAIEELLNNNNDDFEDKNIKLAKYLIEINNLYKISTNEEEIKKLMSFQAKILEGMIELAKYSSTSLIDD